MNPVLKIIKLFLIWRSILFIPVIFASLYLNYGSSFPFFEIAYYKELPKFLDYSVVRVWSNFDGVHYLNIATQGYITEARFFPLFPLLIFLLSIGNISYPVTYIVALLLPNVFFIAALVVFYKLLRLDYNEKISFEALIYLLVFPTAFFFVSVYTESLFLLLLVTSFYFARRKNWSPAILAGVLLISTRFVGILIIPALIYEYFIQCKTLKFKNYLIMAMISLITPLGLVAYSIYNFKIWGNYLYFLTAQGELGNSRSVGSLIIPPQIILRYFKILTTLPMTQFEWWIASLEISSFIFGCFIIYFAWRKKIRISYLIFGSLAFLMPVLSGTFSGLPRYLIIVFPIFIVISLIKSKIVKQAYLIIGITLLFILLMFFSRGYFIA